MGYWYAGLRERERGVYVCDGDVDDEMDQPQENHAIEKND